MCTPPSVAIAQRTVAQRSRVAAHGLEFGRVIPVSHSWFHSCSGSVDPLRYVCAKDTLWACHFTTLLATPGEVLMGGDSLPVITIHAGGPEAWLDQLVCTTISDDPDAVLIQELWDAVPCGMIALRCFRSFQGTVMGPGRGLAILVHGRCLSDVVRPGCVVLHD